MADVTCIITRDSLDHSTAPTQSNSVQRSSVTHSCAQSQVEIRWVNTIDLTVLREFFRAPRGDVPREGLQALEVALKHGASMRDNATLTTRAIFLRTDDNNFRGRLGDGLEVCRHD
jgi:hypothetical protein